MKISVENISKTIRSQKILNSVTFDVNEGEILGIWGPNGAGKTSLLKILTCYLHPDEGNAYYDDYSILENSDEIKSKIGYLSENNPLYEDMNVIDFLQFIAQIHHVPSFYARSRIADIVQMCGLEDEKYKEITNLSKGYKQRVGIAQALVHEPEILIMDEPTTGLDPTQILYIRNVILELNQNKTKTIIISSHLLSEIETICDRVLIMNKGRLIADGSVSELRSPHSAVYVVKIEGSSIVEIQEKLQMMDGVESVKETSGIFELKINKEINIEKEIFDLCVSQHWYIQILQRKETHLNEVFQFLTSKR